MNIPQPLTARARSPVLASMALASMLAVAFALAGCSHKQADGDRLAAMLQLRPGMVVADVGAGSGWMTVMLGARVGPRGHVFSTEIDPRNLGKIRGAVAAAQLHNVTVVQSTASDTGLPANCCEVILLRRVYHHLTDPADIDRSLFHALRPGGRLAVLDFRPTILLWPWKPKGLPPDREGHGISPMTVLSEVEHAGLKYDSMDDPWPGSMFLSNYCLVFTKVPAAEAPAAHAPSADDSIHGAP